MIFNLIEPFGIHGLCKTNSALWGLSANRIYSRFLAFLFDIEGEMSCKIGRLSCVLIQTIPIFFTHLKLWVAVATHNFKLVKIKING